ncbi:MAG TPA: MFS transporter [Anaerolineales bacterium]|nr:MFS transporter [Anaerolineales bacterium]
MKKTLPKKFINISAPARAGRREWIGLVVLALPCLLYSMDLTVLNLAVPSLSADLKPSSTQLLWIVDIYGFLVAGSLITMGTLGDHIGRRRLLLTGAVVFGLASTFAAFANSAGMLIAARALLGLAGATIAPSTLSLIRNMFHNPDQRTFAIGVWATSYSVGGAIGPLLGGLLLEYFWWGSVFLLAVPVMALLLVLGPSLLPEFGEPKTGRLDLISAGMSLAAVLGVIYGLKHIAQDGLSWLSALTILAGLLMGAMFLRRQQILVNPLIQLRLFRSRVFSAALLMNLLGTFIVFGIFLFIAQYLQLVLGLSPLQAGLWTLPQSAGVMASSMLAPAIVRRFRPQFVVAGGLVLLAIGLGLLTQVDGPASLPVLVIGSVILSLGLGPLFVLTTDLILGSAPPEQAGAASALSETGSEFGGAMGIAVLGSLGAAVYRSMMAKISVQGLPLEATETARGTLGGALAVAHQLPNQLSVGLLGAAREAFTQAFETVAVLGAIIALGTAALALIVLRKVELRAEQKAQPPAPAQATTD